MGRAALSAVALSLACHGTPTAHADGSSFLRNDFYGNCITDHGFGQPVSLQSCSPDDPATHSSQDWQFRHLQDGQNSPRGPFVIENDDGCLRRADQPNGLVTLSTCQVDMYGHIVDVNEQFYFLCVGSVDGPGCSGSDYAIGRASADPAVPSDVLVPFERRRPMGVTACLTGNGGTPQTQCGLDNEQPRVSQWTLGSVPMTS